MVFNTNACKFDAEDAASAAAQARTAAFSPAQAAALEKAFAGPKDSQGRQVYPGFLFDTGIASTQGIPGLLHGGQNPVGPRLPRSGWTSIAPAAQATADPAEPLSTTSQLDEPEHVHRPRRQS